MRCPHDGGTCHHKCAEAKSVCFRQAGGMSLSEPWPGFPVAGNMPVSEEHAMGLAHVQAIPPCNTPWPEAPHKYERLGGLRGCTDTTDGYHVVEAGDNVCILCFSKLGGTPVRVPIPRPEVYEATLDEVKGKIRARIPAQTPPARAAADAPVSEEPWSL